MSHGKRILLVEDDELIRPLMAEALNDAGFDILEASSGDEALQLLAQVDDINLVVTDVQMPGRANGIVVAATAKRRHPGIPVIFVTGNPNALRDCVDKQDALLRKPVSPGEVLAMVGRLLPPAKSF